jgi:hypothetical protein
MTDEQRQQLAALPVSVLVEHLAARLGVRRGELQFAIKDGRYDRGRAVLPLTDLPPANDG